jgi:hypothetical protein
MADPLSSACAFSISKAFTIFAGELVKAEISELFSVTAAFSTTEVIPSAVCGLILNISKEIVSKNTVFKVINGVLCI